MDNNNLNLLYLRATGIVMAIGSFVLSLTLTQHDIRVAKGQPGIYNDKTYRDIRIINRSALLLISLIFLYISYAEFTNEKNETKKKDAELLMFVSLALVVGAVIELVLTLKDYDIDILP